MLWLIQQSYATCTKCSGMSITGLPNILIKGHHNTSAV